MAEHPIPPPDGGSAAPTGRPSWSGRPGPFGRFGRGGTVMVAASVLVATLAGGVTGALVAGEQEPATAPTTAAAAARPPAVTGQADVSAVAATVLPSVVQVDVSTARGHAVGSGVILSADGTILTNRHVVDQPGELTVTLNDGRTVPARVVTTADNTDLAVLRAEGVDGLTPAALGDSDSVRTGDQVVAVGSPGGLRGTVTSGIVSAVNREVAISPQQSGANGVPFTGSSRPEATYRAIQTDAAINQGNSGGPLFNTAGQVIGINSSMYSPVSTADGAAGSVGIGFAIPINDARSLIDT